MEATDPQIIAVALAFCRFGMCLMLVPGIGTARVPIRYRLAIALVLAASIGPMAGQSTMTEGDLARAALGEAVTGAMIGSAIRFATFAISFAGALIAAHVGLMLSSPSSIDDHEPSPHLADLLLVMAITALFLSDLHLHLIRTLHQSYVTTPIGTLGHADVEISTLSARLAAACQLGFQLATPLVALSVLVNLVLGILNRALPMVPIQFVGAPALLLLGVILTGDIAPIIGQHFLDAIQSAANAP